MEKRTRELSGAALRLPDHERAALVAEIMTSLDYPGSDDGQYDLHPSWTTVLDRRSAEVDAGVAETVPWETVKELSRQRLEQD